MARDFVLIRTREQFIKYIDWRESMGYNRNIYSTEVPEAYCCDNDSPTHGSVDGDVTKYLDKYTPLEFNQFEAKYLRPKVDRFEAYRQLFNKWIDLNNIKVGDKVKINGNFKHATDKDHTINFPSEMRTFIGMEATITAINRGSDTSYGLRLSCGYNWDFRVLEKIVEEPITYKCGQMFKQDSDTWMLTKISVEGYTNTYAQMVCIKGTPVFIGRVWDDARKIANEHSITKKEFNRIIGGHFKFELIT